MEVNRATISSGSVGSFRSHTTLPVSSTTHTAVSFTETSRPTKYVIAIAPFSLLEVRVTPTWSSPVEGLRSTYSATQPPRYTIFRAGDQGGRRPRLGAQLPAPGCDERPVLRSPDELSGGRVGSEAAVLRVATGPREAPRDHAGRDSA